MSATTSPPRFPAIHTIAPAVPAAGPARRSAAASTIGSAGSRNRPMTAITPARTPIHGVKPERHAAQAAGHDRAEHEACVRHPGAPRAPAARAQPITPAITIPTSSPPAAASETPAG